MRTPLHFSGLASIKSASTLTPLLLALCLFSLRPALGQGSFNQPGGIVYNPDGTLTLSWTGPGSLEFAPSLIGPWYGSISSAFYSGITTQAVSGNMGFFRLNNGSRTSPVLPAPVIPPLPPIVQATIQQLPASTGAGDTLLQVVFQQQPGVPMSRSNFFTIDDQVYMLRDDGVPPDNAAGDGLYSAIIPLSVSELQAWNNHVADVAARGSLTQPVFTGRTITSSNDLSMFDLVSFTSHLIIPLLPFPCSLGASDFYDWRKTLMITDPSVVGDPTRTFDPCGGVGTPMGPWTFGFLMSNMCNQAVTGIDPGDFVRNWLFNWEFDQTVNFDTVNNRSNAIVSQVLNAWMSTSGANLDLAHAPFRLLAIVNRIDLRSHAFPYDNAGECRFVFGVIDPSNPCAFSPLPFTVIFEYGVPLKGCSGIKSWANQWAALNSLPFGPAYNAALEAITDQVTVAGADPSKPNQSAINQIRSNDLLLPVWDLREFTIGTTGFLLEHTVKNTPADHFNNTPTVTSYATDPLNIPNILADSFTVPLMYLGLPFLGAHASTPGGMFWNGFPPGSIAPPVRIHFSLNTCNGCHGGETSTAFTHVSPRPPGLPATLSGFLTGITVPDPAGSPLTSKYADLARRVADLDMVVHKPCVCLSLQRPITTPH